LVEESIFHSQTDRGGDFLRRKSAFPGPVKGPILLLAIPFAQVEKKKMRMGLGFQMPTSKHITIQHIWNLGFKVNF